MSKRKNSLVGGVAILGLAGIISKIIGMFFQIPLTYVIGLDGQGVFQKAYPTYTLLLAISTAGIPVAISRLVAENVTLKRYREAKALLRTALILLAVVGGVLTLLLIALAYPLAVYGVSDPATMLGYRAIAPSILFVSMMSVFRGYLQGRSQMTPTAISQLIEQAGKVCFALPLAWLGTRYGLAWAVGGAFLGITLSELLALVFMFFTYRSKRGQFDDDEAEDTAPVPAFGVLAKRMIGIAIPITIGAIIVPLALNVDSFMITRILTSIGFTLDEARTMFGALNGPTSSLINMPTVFATAVCISLVPLIASARVEGRKEDMHRTSQLGLRLGSLIGLPCAVGMSILATPILKLLYANSLTPEEMVLTGDVLSLSALTIFFFTQVQATTGILQGAGLQKVPMVSLVIGVLCKVVMNLTLVSIPSVNILGAPWASMVCYGVSMTINTVWIVRKTGMRIDWGAVLLRPGLSTAGMAAAVLLMMAVLNMNSRFNTLVAVAAGVLVYVVLVFVTGALRREDMDQVPGGRKLEGLMLKIGVWR